jgi:hypothetical protein
MESGDGPTNGRLIDQAQSGSASTARMVAIDSPGGDMRRGPAGGIYPLRRKPIDVQILVGTQSGHRLDDRQGTTCALVSEYVQRRGCE